MLLRNLVAQALKKIPILYICYDGVLAPLGQSQVSSYLLKLAADYEIHLLSYEKPGDWHDNELNERVGLEIASAGIAWHPLTYHKRPSAVATAFDILLGILAGSWILFRNKIRIVHARSYIASVIALVLKKVFGVKFLFDMRGLWADERVDGGLWPANGKLYRLAKWFEQRFLLSADYVVSLTQSGVEEMKRFPYLQGCMPKFKVITTCTDLDLFKPVSEIRKLAFDQPFTVGYVGSIGLWYLFDETLQCFNLIREQAPNARLHILNKGDHPHIRAALDKHGIPKEAVLLERADRRGVCLAMNRMDVGVFFYKPAFSRIWTAPTKLGEFLGCGVPCLSNVGVGDVASILVGENVGAVLSDFSVEAMRQGIERLLVLTSEPTIRHRCRDVAVRRFSLNKGVKVYAGLYAELSGRIVDPVGW